MVKSDARFSFLQDLIPETVKIGPALEAQRTRGAFSNWNSASSHSLSSTPLNRSRSPTDQDTDHFMDMSGSNEPVNIDQTLGIGAGMVASANTEDDELMSGDVFNHASDFTQL